jgi:acetyl-CoA synthetase
MFEQDATADLAGRVQELLSLFGPDTSAATLLCDRHDPAAIAYRIVGADLSLQELTYAELRAASSALAGGLVGLGLGPGDRIATLMGKSAEYLVTLIAIWRLGAVHVPLFTAFGAQAIASRLSASGCKLVVCDQSQRPKLDPGDASPADAPWRVVTTGAAQSTDLSFEVLAKSESLASAAVLGGEAPLIHIFTSGTTGTPKAVAVPIKALACFQAYAEFGLDLREDDIFWNAADPGWGYGLYFGVLAAFTTGCAGMFLQGGFSAEGAYEVLERFAITNFAAAPTVYRALRNAEPRAINDLKLRCASSAGEPLTPEVNEWALPTLGIAVHDHFGQTEAGMLINNHHHPALRRPLKTGCMGRAMPGWTAVVLKMDVDEPAPVGELGRLAMDLSHSPFAWFDGYLNEPGRTAEKFTGEGRWYLTGDVARVDDEGDFYFASREDDVIIMAGYRIGPSEVEAVILTHPAVSECAVVAVPDSIRGEVLEAVVVLRPGNEASDALSAEIKAHVKTGYAAHAYPRRVHYASSLPKTPSGKVQRFLVRNELRQVSVRPPAGDAV